jgi:uncharacterized protein YjbI with pentapeptide repeats
MPRESGLPIEKPVSIWQRPVQVDYRELFKRLGQAVANGAMGNYGDIGANLVEAVAAFSLQEKDPEHVAWQLVHRAIGQAMASLLKDNQTSLVKQPDSAAEWGEYVGRQLEAMDLAIDRSFFQYPKRLPLVEKVQGTFGNWLEKFVVHPAAAQAMAARLPSYFVVALHEEWRQHPQEYAGLQKQLDTPFAGATEREQAWARYRAWLQKRVEEPMFLEPFGLKQVYVPLNAYYVQKAEDEGKRERFGHDDRGKPEAKRVVIQLEETLQAWLQRADRQDAIRVICGGPGCGKSSFTKIWAAKLAESAEVPVLFIPLHHFNPGAELMEAIDKFIRDDYDGILPPNPLQESHREPRLLLIFDGLDELAMQGKVGAEVAQQFIQEVIRQVDRVNHQALHLQVLLSGRDVAVQASSERFRKEGQILHVLPYYVDLQERRQYEDPKALLQEDLRNQWWQNYGAVSGRKFAAMPQELARDNLSEITAQPLLNYLIALSYMQGNLTVSDSTNLNEIYANLLSDIYKRGWADSQHPALAGVSSDRFGRILEEIALAAWHGDGRTTTVTAITEHCNKIGSQGLLESLQTGAERTGITRLLLAFYFRQNGNLSQGEKTFEFTHKSFGEYLTACRLIRGIRRIHTQLEIRKQDADSGFDEKTALVEWARLCGPSPIDHYLMQFLQNEMRLQDLEEVKRWQFTLCHLIEIVLKRGLPMEQLSLATYHEANRQARNAEETLLVALSACARCTEELSKINWPMPEAFGTWLHRLRGQRSSFSPCLAALSFLDLEGCILSNQDLDGASLGGASLDGAHLVGASLLGASLGGASLDGARLDRARLVMARLIMASLNGAILNGAALNGAILNGTILDGAILDGAILDGAILDGVLWDEKTSWLNARYLDKAIGLPEEWQMILEAEAMIDDEL